MKFIGWLLSPILIIGLRLPSYTPLELFHRFAVRAVLPYVLHTARIYGKRRGELVRLLKHKKLPFDWFYEDSCMSLMDPVRLKDILELSRVSDREQLLSLKCIESLTFSLSNLELDELGPKNFFDRVSEQAPAFYANDHSFFDLLKSYHHPSSLVQDCSWLTSGRVHDRVFKIQAHEHIDRPDAWRMFHHSCFFSGRTGNPDFDRMHVLVFWLRDEVPMRQFITMNPRVQLKWLVHLLVILKRIEIEFAENSVYLVVPLTEYLSRLENCLGPFSLMRALIRYCCRAWFKKDQLPKEPNLPCIGDILLEIRKINDDAEENVRWTLAVLDLYHLIDGKDIWRRKNFDRILIENIILASPIEQSNWIRIYLEAPKRLHFLESTLIHLISRSNDLQSWIMSKSKGADPPVLSRLIFGSVPFSARLKETRARYFKAPNRFAGRLVQLYRIASTRPEPSRSRAPGFEMEHAILAYLSELGPYVTYNADSCKYKIALLSPGRMSGFAFIMSTAKLFSIPLGYFDFCNDQERLIFGAAESSLQKAIGLFYSFEQTGRPPSDMLRLSDCKIIRHEEQFPVTICGETCSNCKVIYFEDVLVRLSKAVTSSAEVFGQLIDYNELS